MGKTSIAMAAYKFLKNKKAAKGMLVVGPLRPVYSVWPPEKDKWSDFEHFSVGILHGSNKEEVLFEDHDIYCINYEGIEWLFGRVQPKKPNTKGMPEAQKKVETEKYNLALSRWKIESNKAKKRLKRLLEKVDILVFDELSKMKHADTQRAKSIKPHLHKFSRRWGLTGSPAANGLMDLFGECYMLDLGKSLGRFITHYRAKYFNACGFMNKEFALKPEAEEKIYEAVRPLMFRLDGEEHLKLPKMIINPIYIDLDEKARKVYDTMEEEMFAEVNEEDFLAMTSSAAAIKCQQIANGALYKDRVDPLTGLPRTGKREWTAVHDHKLDALEDLIDELQGQQILVGYHFGHDLQRILERRKSKAYSMAVAPKEAEKIRLAWNRGEVRELYGHPASMGHGLNMQESNARHVGFYNVPFDLELYDQFRKRVRRQGNEADHVTIHLLVVRDTVDVAKMNALHSKEKGQKAFMDAMKQYKRNRSGR